MEVSVLLLVSVGIHGGAQQLLEPPQSRHPQDGEVALTEKRLEQREVDLQSHIIRVVGRQHAQDNAVRVTAKNKVRG